MNKKWIALVCLVIQNSSLALLMRYSYLNPKSGEHIYFASTAVLLAEVFKLLISIVCCFYIDGKGNLHDFMKVCQNDVFSNGWDWIHLTVPSTLYTIQNSLQYISTSQLSAPVFQVLSQLKIVTTAFCSVLLLSKRISLIQWLSLLGLTCGVALVQISQQDLASVSSKSNSYLGFFTVFCGCLTSGFAGVYFEKILKSSNTGLWVRNIQLSAIGVVTGLISCVGRNREDIMTYGFFTGYSKLVWGVIFLQVAGGLIVALVVKFADNVMKGFATSISILVSSFVSWRFLNDFQVTSPFLLGSLFVLSSLFMYTSIGVTSFGSGNNNSSVSGSSVVKGYVLHGSGNSGSSNSNNNNNNNNNNNSNHNNNNHNHSHIPKSSSINSSIHKSNVANSNSTNAFVITPQSTSSAISTVKITNRSSSPKLVMVQK